MAGDAVKTGVFVEVIVQVAVPGLGAVLKQRQQTYPMHRCFGCYTRSGQQCGRKIDVLYQSIRCTTGLDVSLPLHQQRHLRGHLVHPAFVEPAVFSEEKALVRTVQDDSIFHQTISLEII